MKLYDVYITKTYASYKAIEAESAEAATEEAYKQIDDGDIDISEFDREVFCACDEVDLIEQGG